MQNIRKMRFIVALAAVLTLTVVITQSAFTQYVPPAPTQRLNRFGVYHWFPDFTAKPLTRDKLNWGADLVASTETRTIRVFLGAQDFGSGNEDKNCPCWRGPYGVNPDPPRDPNGAFNYAHPDFLKNIAASPKYQELFSSNRFDTFLLTSITNDGQYRTWSNGYTPQGTEWNTEKNQIKNLGAYLLDTYPNKTFIILNWEGDADLISSGNPDGNVEHWKNYMQARVTGVIEARTGHANPKLYSGIELSCASMPCAIGNTQFNNEANLVKNYVLPRVTGYDYVSYSAWQTTALYPGRTAQQLQNDLRSALSGILAKARESSPAYTNANLIIGEAGYRRGWSGIMSAFDWLWSVFSVAETEGIAHVIYWQAMDDSLEVSSVGAREGGLYEAVNGQAVITPVGNAFKQLEFWNNLGGELTSGVGACSWGVGRLDAFVRGTDNGLYHRWTGDGGVTWNGYHPLGGGLTSAPAAVSYGANKMAVFVRGTDNGLHYQRYENGSWSGWIGLGGLQTSSAPAAASWGPGRIDVFVRGLDNLIYHRFTGDGGVTWSTWGPFAGTVTSDPAAVSSGFGKVAVFARGPNNDLIYRAWDNGWSAWQSLGGVLTAAPAASSWGPGRTDVFVRGTTGRLYRNYTDNSGISWSGWGYIEGPFSEASPEADKPAAVSWGSGRIDVFVKGTDNALWRRWYDNSLWLP